MKRFALFLASIVSVTLIAGAWIHAGSSDPGFPQTPSDPQLKSPSATQNWATDSAALRWREGLPNHWRSCLLQR